jgi:nitrate reductase beta subunit
VGHPLHLHRQPADADAEPRRPGGLAERDDAKRAGIVDNDWVEVFNINGAIAARAVVSQRVNPGMVLMYHAQEKIVNTPGSEITGMRGGIHNSVTRIVLKPTHMIGGYAQFSYGFNYYGTIGTNRDEFVVVRKMAKVDWLDTPRPPPPSTKRVQAPEPGEGENESRAQIGMVLNLDKCIGCHTCFGHLQERLDQPPGVEYAWFNNVETKPGIGYPKEWENQDKWNGGWVAQGQRQDRAAPGRQVEAADAHLRQPQPAADRRLLRAVHLRLRPPAVGARDEGAPTARPRSLITGERMEKIEWGPNWEEILGGEFAKRSKDKNFDDIQKDIYGQFENTFMMYLPRLCEHCLNPACVASCPSGSIYKREEDGIVLIDQDKCRGWRMCVSGCPYKKIYYNWKSGKAEKCIFCYPRIEAGQPTVCSETCVGRIRYLGVLLYDADRIQEAASVEHDRGPLPGPARHLPRPERPEGDRAGAHRRHPRQLAGAARKSRRSTRWRWTGRWRCPLHPEYRTLPMVWYVPPLSPISAAANAGQMGINGEIPDVKRCASR